MCWKLTTARGEKYNVGSKVWIEKEAAYGLILALFPPEWAGAAGSIVVEIKGNHRRYHPQTFGLFWRKSNEKL